MQYNLYDTVVEYFWTFQNKQDPMGKLRQFNALFSREVQAVEYLFYTQFSKIASNLYPNQWTIKKIKAIVKKSFKKNVS